MNHPPISMSHGAIRFAAFGWATVGAMLLSPLVAQAETLPGAASPVQPSLVQPSPVQPSQAEIVNPVEGAGTVAQAAALGSSAEEFAQRGQKRWYVQGAGASTWTGSPARRFGLLGAGASRFFADGHSVNLELNGMAFDQNGGDAAGLNFSTILRWHFLRQENWSMYLDGGAGLLGTTNQVPAAGSSFNFTPQVGGGVTVRLNERQRLMLGLRWHHISNADTFESNPGRDSVMGYVGLNLPR